jgi:hypothetical protein
MAEEGTGAFNGSKKRVRAPHLSGGKPRTGREIYAVGVAGAGALLARRRIGRVVP